MPYEITCERAPGRNGKPGKGFVNVYAPYCSLTFCERCNKPGPSNRVRRWYYRTYPIHDAPPLEPILCLGCCNRLRPLWRTEKIVRENRALISRIVREVANVRRAA